MAPLGSPSSPRSSTSRDGVRDARCLCGLPTWPALHMLQLTGPSCRFLGGQECPYKDTLAPADLSEGGWLTFAVKGRAVNILGFVDRTVSVANYSSLPLRRERSSHRQCVNTQAGLGSMKPSLHKYWGCCWVPPLLEGRFHFPCSGLGEKNKERKRESSTSDPRHSSGPAGHGDGLWLGTCLSSRERAEVRTLTSLAGGPWASGPPLSAAPGRKGAKELLSTHACPPPPA